MYTLLMYLIFYDACREETFINNNGYKYKLAII